MEYTKYTKYIGKRYTWSCIKIMFPDKWVLLTDYEFDEFDNLKTGIIRAICSDEEDLICITENIIKTNPNTRVYWVRTNEMIGIKSLWF